MRWNYVFIGAGPASLAATNILIERGVRDVLILEEGNRLAKRGCPGRPSHTCIKCPGGICHVIKGQGGSSASFGNKLCYFPASQSIKHYFSSEVMLAANNYLDVLLESNFRSSNHATELSQSQRKHYIADILHQQKYQRLMTELLDRPVQHAYVRTNKSVVLVEKKQDSRFSILTADGDTFEAENVVLGCGRSSHVFLRQLFESLGVVFLENHPDIGLRFEAPSEVFSQHYSYQNDPKLKFDHGPRGTSRTFCACNGGAIVPVQFGDSHYAEGVFLNSRTSMNNLAFMARSRRAVSAQELERWCWSINKAYGGSLLLGEIELRADMSYLVDSIMSLLPTWPHEDHQIMMRELLQKSMSGERGFIDWSRCDGRKAKIYGPAIDLYWPAPQLQAGLRTSVEGLFVLGDATGVSRGIVQALISGAAWACTQEHRVHENKRTHSMAVGEAS